MLFHSVPFLFGFLPLALAGFVLATRAQERLPAVAWLTAASLFFYAWWNVSHLALLVASVAGNYAYAQVLARHRERAFVVTGVALNLLVLGWFKYFNFFIDSAALLLGIAPAHLAIALPLGISFFTFQQIAYLVDVYHGHPPAPNFLYYVLFVAFFPHLIAGPILHHADVIPQFQKPSVFRIQPQNLAVGSTIFAIGLYKKVVFADGISVYAETVFNAAVDSPPDFFTAWSGVLAYTMQIYFDFSGYSDMAIGLARLFGVRLPLNFHSPYKAVNIIDFWRRWHMTLSRFLRDYLYIPLGGNRRGGFRRYINLMITMLLGGLWHGAGWTFVIWGGLHGCYLVVNHLWRRARHSMGSERASPTAAGTWLARFLTFGAVVVAWVFFRAADVATAWTMLSSLAGMNGVIFPEPWRPAIGSLVDGVAGVSFGPSPGLDGAAFGWIGFLLLVVWFAPNTQELLARYKPAFDYPQRPGGDDQDAVSRLVEIRPWRDALASALILSTAVVLMIVLARKERAGAFIYMIF